jgi:hypothetical protein
MAYWIALSAYLMVYFFPVPPSRGETVFNTPGQSKLIALSQDWVPVSGADPVAISPREPRVREPTLHDVDLALLARSPDVTPLPAFHARAPPAAR